MAFQENRVKNIQTRNPNTVVTEHEPETGHAVKTVKTFNLGHWEIAKVQEGLDNLEPADRERMAYLEWLLGSCESVEITITATYER